MSRWLCVDPFIGDGVANSDVTKYKALVLLGNELTT